MFTRNIVRPPKVMLFRVSLSPTQARYATCVRGEGVSPCVILCGQNGTGASWAPRTREFHQEPEQGRGPWGLGSGTIYFCDPQANVNITYNKEQETKLHSYTWNIASNIATNMLDALFLSSSNELIGFAEMPTRFRRVLMLA